MSATAVPGSNGRLNIHNIRENVVGIGIQVPLADGTRRPYVNFDNAASTPVLRPVLDKVDEFLGWYSSVHRGTGFKSQVSTQVFEETRRIVSSFVGADPRTNVVIYTKNTSDALNKLARRFPFQPGDVVLTTLMEHHSNDLPWRAVAQVEHIDVDENGALDEDHMDSLLSAHRGRVRLVAVAGATNVTGYINPVHRIAEKAHAAGAQIVVDAAQLAAHWGIDMRPNDDPGHLDYVALAAHKMYAPYGIGALLGRRETFTQGVPDGVGGGTVDLVTTDDILWSQPPAREEVGSPNVVGAVALAKAILCLQEIGMAEIVAHETRLTSYLLERMARIPGIHIFGNGDPAHTAENLGVVSFTVEGMHHRQVANLLSAVGGIGVRDGLFCAHPYLLRLLQISPEQIETYRHEVRQGHKAGLPGMIRVSLSCYNNEAEVDWFVEVLERIVRGECPEARPSLTCSEFEPYFTLR